MAGRKRMARSAAPPASPGDWIRDRPRFPSVYGISESAEGLMPWSHVDERMSKALRYWVSSVDGEGRPHATPVDGMWIDGKLYFGGNPATRRNRNLVANPAACIHLEEAMDVVILQGDARELDSVSPELSERIIQNSKEKYGFAPPVDDLGAGGIFEFEPSLALTWKDFTKDATRFRRPGVRATTRAASRSATRTAGRPSGKAAAKPSSQRAVKPATKRATKPASERAARGAAKHAAKTARKKA